MQRPYAPLRDLKLVLSRNDCCQALRCREVPLSNYACASQHFVLLRRLLLSALQAVLQYYWRRAARIVPAFWVSLVLTNHLVLRDRAATAAIPEAASALFHYPADQCPGKLQITPVSSLRVRKTPIAAFCMSSTVPCLFTLRGCSAAPFTLPAVHELCV